MEINCGATPRFIATCRKLDPIFAEQHILVAFQLLVLALKFNLNVAKPNKLDLLKAVAKDRI